MKVIIEGKQEEFDLTGKKVTLKNIISEVERFLHDVGKLPISLKFDGKNLTQEELDLYANEPLTSNSEIEFDVVDILSHIAEQITSCKENNKSLVQLIKTLSENPDESSELKQKAIVYLHDFLQFWAQIKQMIPSHLADISQGGESLKEVLDRCFSKGEEIINPLENKENFLVSDILFYEALPSIEKVIEMSESLAVYLKESSSSEK
jgi:hypothetical protein